MTVRLADGLSSSDREALMDEVAALPGVASVEYVSPEEAMERLREAYARVGQELDLGGANIQPVRQPRDHA